MTRTMMLLGVAAALNVAPVKAQQSGEDDRGVRETIQRLFDGMREADSAKTRSALADGARFAGTDTSGVKFTAVDGWVRSIANSRKRWNEVVYDVQVRVDGEVAQAWAPYTFYLDNKISHCGVDSFELVRTRAGWKITQLADTRRNSGCPDPINKK
jgi:hypothetical protein